MNADNPLYALSPLIWFLTGGGAGLFRKLIKPLTCELVFGSGFNNPALNVLCPVMQSVTALKSDYTHTHLLDIIRQIRLQTVNVWMCLKTSACKV